MNDSRFTLRWDATNACYRVNIPMLDGPLEVVPAADYDEAIAMRDGLGASAIAACQRADQIGEMYEAAMNWFLAEEWRAFEESDEFKAAEALATSQERSDG